MMKKHYYFLFAITLIFGGLMQASYAQEVENPSEVLVENNWFLHTLIIQGESKDFIPDQSAAKVPLNFYLESGDSDCDGSLSTTFCESDFVMFTRQGDNELFTEGWGYLARPFETSNCDFMVPPPENGATTYQYFVLFWENNCHSHEYGIYGSIYHYTYTITEIESGFELVITNDIGVEAIFRDTYLGVDENVLSQIKIYPNPVKDFLHIENLLSKTYLEIYDLNGRLLLEKTLTDSSEAVEVNFLSQGIYVYKIMDENQNSKTGKLIKE